MPRHWQMKSLNRDTSPEKWMRICSAFAVHAVPESNRINVAVITVLMALRFVHCCISVTVIGFITERVVLVPILLYQHVRCLASPCWANRGRNCCWKAVCDASRPPIAKGSSSSSRKMHLLASGRNRCRMLPSYRFHLCHSM